MENFPFILKGKTIHNYPIINLDLGYENELNRLMIKLYKDNGISFLFLMTLYYWSIPNDFGIEDMRIRYKWLMKRRVEQLNKVKDE